MEMIDRMDEAARQIRATEQVFQIIIDAIPHEDMEVDLDVELEELAEMDTVIGRQG